MRATCASVFHGISWNVDGSGKATMSDSWIRLKPSIDEPSNPIPSVKAPSSSWDVIVNDFRKPRTSVNQSRTNRIPRSSMVFRTYSASALNNVIDLQAVGAKRDGTATSVPPSNGRVKSRWERTESTERDRGYLHLL
jgi:hypothetical protein